MTLLRTLLRRVRRRPVDPDRALERARAAAARSAVRDRYDRQIGHGPVGGGGDGF